MEERAYAKLNLALHVRGRAPDGYHRIETLFAFAEDGDRLSVAKADDLSLDVAGRFADAVPQGNDNLVLRAAQMLRDRFAVAAGAALSLDKMLPVAAGLGGGSADAAAALRLLARFWALDEADAVMMDIAGALGADVPACLQSRMARGERRGDILSPVDDDGFASAPLLLVNPSVQLSTRDVFATWDGHDCGPLADGPPGAAALAGRNDLERSARALAPAIGKTLAMLHGAGGAMLARMSGSGPTCFAIYASDQDRDSARAAIASAQPGWWCFASRLRASAEAAPA
jgi:4-diphosphocytidyl-2-C-methyl-D-erythritol kinase